MQECGCIKEQSASKGAIRDQKKTIKNHAKERAPKQSFKPNAGHIRKQSKPKDKTPMKKHTKSKKDMEKDFIAPKKGRQSNKSHQR